MSAKAAAPLNADIREQAGTGAARAVRRAGKIPAVLYSKSSEPVSLAIPEGELRQQYLKGRFRSRLVELKLGGKDVVKALPRDIQFHPVTDKIEHVDFQRIDAGVPIHVFVPVKFLGAEKSPGLKRGGVLNIVRHDVEFVCKPEAIPHHIEADVSKLEIGGSIHINDIPLLEGIEAVIKRNFTVATIAGRSKEEEAPVAAAVTAAAPADGAAAPAADAAKAAEAPKKDEKK